VVACHANGEGLGVGHSHDYRLLERKSGEAVQSRHRWIFGRNLICVLTVIAAAGCNRPADGLRHDDENNSAMTREDVRQRQLDFDVAAMVRGMALAHGAQVVALAPEQ
jgi:hypothetical protein